MKNVKEFSALRYGMFVHFGLFSRQARGEWCMNREQISPAEMKKIAGKFHPEKFNADEICRLAADGGMKYIVFTTMHHEGFRLYDTKLSDFNSMKYCGRDFVKEIVEAAGKYGLKTGLYHSLNNWTDQPDAVSALENRNDYNIFIRHTFERLKELVTLFNPIDILWYDGWWPFNRDGWQAEKMNEELRKIQPWLLFNGRNGLPGDFGTPEQHLTAPVPWRPWEACMTLNNHWGWHRSDHCWKSPVDVINMLLTCGMEQGNLLLNIGPRGDGSVPAESVRIIRTVGQWLQTGGAEVVRQCEKLPFSPTLPGKEDRGDWDPQGRFTACGSKLYFIMHYNPGGKYVLAGLRAKVSAVTTCGIEPLKFVQEGEKITVALPKKLKQMVSPVLTFHCDRKPVIYRTGGMRTPECPHPRYDPLPPDIQYEN